MRIKSIDISAFGRLKDLHIKPSDGLNIIYGENGSGKSTVMDFIKAVFYGMGRGRDRSRRIPWDGAKASGSISYSSDEGDFICQAAFGKTARGDKCEVFNDVSGELISTEYQGEKLFSISDVTFAKTAFIGCDGAFVEQKGDDEIAQKLSNLKETGDDRVSFSAVSSDVDSYMARLIAKRGRGGRIQQLEDSIEELKSELDTAKQNAESRQSVKKAVSDARERGRALAEEIGHLKRMADIADFRYCRDIKQKLDRIPTTDNTHAAEEALQKIEELTKRLSGIESRIAELNIPKSPKATISEQEFTDVTECYYAGGKSNKKMPFILMLVLSLAFAILGIMNPFFFAGTVIFAVLAFVYRPKSSHKDKLSDMLGRYGEGDYESFRTRYMEQEREAALRKNNEESISALKEEAEEISQLLAREKSNAAKDFGDWQSLGRIVAEEKKASEERQRLTAAFEAALRGRDYEELKQRFDDPSVEIPYDYEYRLKEAEYQLSQNNETIAALERRGGALEAGESDVSELTRRIAELSDKKAELKSDYNVLSVVLDVLNEAYEVMEGEFGEKLNLTAGSILEGITGYKTARMSRDFDIKLSENGEIHGIWEFSTGLYQQTYLAFRLAMLSLMGTDCPLFLDDSLMSYDDERAQKLISYLNEISKTRQIFLFTCRRRDLNMAKELGANCIEI